MKTKIFIDFDGTLYNTSELKEKFARLLENFGVNRDAFISAYKDECRDNLFSVGGVLRRIYNLTDVDRAEITKKEFAFHNDDPNLIYGDVILFLKTVNREEYEVDLITMGNPDFQSIKIEHSGIREYFDNIFYTTCEKWDYFDSIVTRDEKFVFIDDREDTIFLVQHKFENSRSYCIVRDDRDHDDPSLGKNYEGIKIIDTLKEIEL